MNWWCAATDRPWSWSFVAYPGIWAAMAALIVLYVRSWRHLRHAGELEPGDQKRRWSFAAGVAVLWVATDWPVGALGAGYLASVHMVQFQLYTLVASPLIVFGLPPAMVHRMTQRLRLDAALPVVARPLVAGVTFNVLLLVTHSPIVIDQFRSSAPGSFVLDTIWLVAGTVLWLPVLGPEGTRIRSAGVQCLYLFFAMGVVPMIPGAFLTFADHPLYRLYELAPRVGGIDAVSDQQVAGLLMKVGNLPVLWLWVTVIFFRWASAERRAEKAAVTPVLPEREDSSALSAPAPSRSGLRYDS